MSALSVTAIVGVFSATGAETLQVSPDPGDGAIRLAKKGGEPCDDDADCETKTCKGGACDSCPNAENCPPPGTCEQSKHDGLQKVKNKACKGSGELSCEYVDHDDSDADCENLKAHQTRAKACYDSRVAADGCFLGGNERHRDEQANAKEVADKCSEIIEYKLERDICYECDDYQARLKAVRDAWKKPDECTEKKDAAKVDCGKMREKIANAGEVKSALDAFKGCFNNQLSKPRLERYNKASSNEANCRDILDYKEGKSLCQ
jgi:hypothetical protein